MVRRPTPPPASVRSEGRPASSAGWPTISSVRCSPTTSVRPAWPSTSVPATGHAAKPGTARCLILVTADAQRTMNTYLGVSAHIGTDDVEGVELVTAKVLYCEGYLWDEPTAKAALRHAMDHARQVSTPVAFTLSDSFCVDRHRAEFLDLVADHVDILFANEAEICSLYEVDDFDEAARRVAGHVGIACLTRSERGSVDPHVRRRPGRHSRRGDRRGRHHRRRRPLRRRFPGRVGRPEPTWSSAQGWRRSWPPRSSPTWGLGPRPTCGRSPAPEPRIRRCG